MNCSSRILCLPEVSLVLVGIDWLTDFKTAGIYSFRADSITFLVTNLGQIKKTCQCSLETD